MRRIVAIALAGLLEVRNFYLRIQFLLKKKDFVPDTAVFTKVLGLSQNQDGDWERT